MSYQSASSDSSCVIKLVVDLSTVILNYHIAILTSATIFCFMNFFTAITAPVSAQVTKPAGRDLSQCCFSRQEYLVKRILRELRVLGIGKLFRWVTNRLNEVEMSFQGRGQVPTGGEAGVSPDPTIDGLLQAVS